MVTALALSGIPLYQNGDVLKIAIESDPNIVKAHPPAVNRVSAELKSKGAVIVDGLTTDGLQLVSAGIGDCDAGYQVVELFDALNHAAREDHFELPLPASLAENTMHLPYGDVRGIGALISGAKSFLDALLGVEVRDYVTVTHGGRAMVFMAIKAFASYMEARLKERGITGLPKIAVPVPTWGTYPNIIAQALHADCFVPIMCPDGLLTAELLDEACKKDPSISMLIYCNPVNPTGLTYGSDRQANIARIVFKHKLAVHCDDMYAMFSWKRPHRSLLRAAAAMANGEEREVGTWVASHLTTLTGVMKAGGSGTRVNFLVTPNPELRARVTAIQGDLFGPPNMLGQLLQLAFLKNNGPQRVWLQLNERRIALEAALAKLKSDLTGTGIEVTWTTMEGGFYTSVYFRGVQNRPYTNRAGNPRTIESGERFSHFLLEYCGTIISPDIAACIDDPEMARIAYGMMSPKDIMTMGEQLARGLKKLVTG